MSGWNTIKIDKADRIFSKYIRLRDGACVKCGRRGEGADKINGLQCSHFWSRRGESTRYDVENCDALCIACHKYLGEHRDEYKTFKKEQLGTIAYNRLDVRAHTYAKKDRVLQAIIACELLKTLKK